MPLSMRLPVRRCLINWLDWTLNISVKNLVSRKAKKWSFILLLCLPLLLHGDISFGETRDFFLGQADNLGTLLDHSTNTGKENDFITVKTITLDTLLNGRGID